MHLAIVYIIDSALHLVFFRHFNQCVLYNFPFFTWLQGERFTCNYSRNGIVKLQINGFTAADVGTYECVAHNDYGDMAQPVIAVMAQYPEFIKSPTEVNLIGVNGGKIECEIFGVPKPKVS